MGGSPSQSGQSGATSEAYMPGYTPNPTSYTPTFNIGGSDSASVPSGSFGGNQGLSNPFAPILPQSQPQAAPSIPSYMAASPTQSAQPGQIPISQIQNVSALLSGVKPANAGVSGLNPQQIQAMLSSVLPRA